MLENTSQQERTWKFSSAQTHKIAEWLKENGLPKATWIDIDLNPDPKYKSNSVLRQAVGLVEGMGYKVRYKHLGALTTYAANHLVRI